MPNKPRKIYIIEGGRKVTAIDLAQELNVNLSTMQSRLVRGKVFLSDLGKRGRIKSEIYGVETTKNKHKFSWERKKTKVSWNGPFYDELLKLAMRKI